MQDPTEAIEDLRNKLICPCGCGKNQTSTEFASTLYMAQGIYGKPFTITSGFRCLKHNEAVKGDPNSASLYGEHADIDYHTPAFLFLIIKALVGAGFERFRLYPRHLHIDRSRKHPFPTFTWANYPPPKPKEA